MDTVFQQPAPFLAKSQLRRLARQYYVGEIDEADYRRRRRTLIDGIVDGDVAIERDAPPPPPAPVSPEPPPLVPEDAPARPRISPVHAGVGVLVLAAAAWALWPHGEPEAPVVVERQPPGAAPVDTRLPTKTIPESRTLVESFLAAREWSDPAIAKFERRWEALPDAEREDARSSPWFRRLTKTIRDELKTQNALAEFDQTGSAKAATERLTAFRERLGGGSSAAARPVAPATEPIAVAPASPTTPAAGTGTPSPASSATAVTATPAAAPAPPRTAAISPPPAPPPATAAAPARVAGTERPSGNAWLEAQPAGSFTLQLFALNHLDRIERLMAAHPGIEFRVIAAQGTPRYRVLHGSYASEEQARAAHGALPGDVRAARPEPLVRTFAELRERPATADPAPAPASAASAPGDWLSAAGRDKFTLQLFASDRRESVEHLVARNPGLDLRVVHTRSGRSLYRVVHGVYASTEAASSASSALPAGLLLDTGKPLVKSIAELQDTRAR